VAIDLYMVAAVAVILFLSACVGILFLMRDTRTSPPRHVSGRLWCENRGRRADVEFLEAIHSGMPAREVVACSLRAPYETCAESCRDLPATRMRPLAETPTRP